MEEWRPGVRTRLLASAATGARSLCVFEQWSEPGCGAPVHTHPGVEEVVVVLGGRAEIRLEDETVLLDGGGAVVVPPGARHAFRNLGEGTLHTLATLAHRAPPVSYEDGGEAMTIGAVRGGPHRIATGR